MTRRAAPRKYDLEKEFQFIKGYIAANGYPPTDKLVGLAFGMPKATAYYHRIIMAARGWLRWQKYYPRTMKVTR